MRNRHIGVGRPLRAIELPDDQPQHMPVEMPPAQPVSTASHTDPIDLRHVIETLEQDRIQMALVAADGVISEAARLLTLKRTTLIEKMRKYGVGKQAA